MQGPRMLGQMREFMATKAVGRRTGVALRDQGAVTIGARRLRRLRLRAVHLPGVAEDAHVMVLRCVVPFGSWVLRWVSVAVHAGQALGRRLRHVY